MRGTELPHGTFSIVDIEAALESAESDLGAEAVPSSHLRTLLKDLPPIFNLLHVLASSDMQERVFNVQMMLLEAARELLAESAKSPVHSQPAALTQQPVGAKSAALAKQPVITQPDPLLADLQHDVDSAAPIKQPEALQLPPPQRLAAPPAVALKQPENSQPAPTINPDLLPLKVHTTELCVCDKCQSDDMDVTLPWCYSKDEQIQVEYECRACHHRGLDLVLRTEALRVRQAHQPQQAQADSAKQTALQQPAEPMKQPGALEPSTIEVTLPATSGKRRGRPKKEPAGNTEQPVVNQRPRKEPAGATEQSVATQRAASLQQPVVQQLAAPQQPPVTSKQSTNDLLDKILASAPISAHPDKILQELLPQVLAWPPAKILKEYEQMTALKAPTNPSQAQLALMAKVIAGRIVGVPVTA